jgi:hypothetical protein
MSSSRPISQIAQMAQASEAREGFLDVLASRRTRCGPICPDAEADQCPEERDIVVQAFNEQRRLAEPERAIAIGVSETWKYRPIGIQRGGHSGLCSPRHRSPHCGLRTAIRDTARLIWVDAGVLSAVPAEKIYRLHPEVADVHGAPGVELVAASATFGPGRQANWVSNWACGLQALWATDRKSVPADRLIDPHKGAGRPWWTTPDGVGNLAARRQPPAIGSIDHAEPGSGRLLWGGARPGTRG